MNQIELAIKYLKKRAIPAEKVNKQLLYQFHEIISIIEVTSILEMLNTGEFEKWYNEIKKQENGFI
jgi:NAD-dependent DNA ligase